MRLSGIFMLCCGYGLKIRSLRFAPLPGSAMPVNIEL